MKKTIFILSVALVFLLIIWVVVRMHRADTVTHGDYQASTRDEKITIYDIDDLEGIGVEYDYDETYCEW